MADHIPQPMSPMTVVLRALVAFAWLFSPVMAPAQTLPKHGENGFAYPSAYSATLAHCVIIKRVETGDVAACERVVESMCMLQTGGHPARISDVALCLLEEQFAWGDILQATAPDRIGVASGRTQIDTQDYIEILAVRFPQAREKCHALAETQQEAAMRCQITAFINDVRWHYDLYDNGG